MVTTKVKAGVCGFVTDITAASEDSQNVTFGVRSDCEKISKLAGFLPVVDAYSEIGAGFNGQLYETIRAQIKGCCAGCAVVVGLFKSMQVAAQLALPQEISITISKSE